MSRKIVWAWLALLTLIFLAPRPLVAQGPGQDSFAGEPLPMNRPEVAENLDQELLLLSEAKSRVWLTLRRSGRYLPIIDAALAQAGISSDFRYLPMTLTQLSPTYQAQGRAGLWRLSQAEAKALELQITAEVDERLDPVLASTKAAQKLKSLIKVYGSNLLALAAYIDEGSTGLALTAAGEERNFFKIYWPENLEKSVYQVLAGKILFGAPQNYGYLSVRSWPVLAKRRQKLTEPQSLKDLASQNKLDYKTFREMNPHILGETAPAGVNVYLP
ncbi:MAG: transglycosylase SLT domain-containing protein [Deltaproteobacteria bacterium]|nr:transglycosylase SLT domain-containing protein [Deltaproteobacteria bacterium]